MSKKVIIGVVGLVAIVIVGICFSQPLKPYEVDKHTLFLCHFDKGAEADYSKGTPTPLRGDGEIGRKIW